MKLALVAQKRSDHKSVNQTVLDDRVYGYVQH
jgi:hypothetical protein